MASRFADITKWGGRQLTKAPATPATEFRSPTLTLLGGASSLKTAKGVKWTNNCWSCMRPRS